MTVKDHPGDVVVEAQNAWKALSDSWAQSVEQIVRRAPTLPLEALDANKPLDLVFDLTGRLLEANRQYARSLAEASIAFGAALRDYVESIREVLSDQYGAPSEQPAVVQEAERQVARPAKASA
jgi:hypothetical protein